MRILNLNLLIIIRLMLIIGDAFKSIEKAIQRPPATSPDSRKKESVLGYGVLIRHLYVENESVGDVPNHQKQIKNGRQAFKELVLRREHVVGNPPLRESTPQEWRRSRNH